MEKSESKKCNCTAVLTNIADELDNLWEDCNNSNFSEEAREAYEVQYAAELRLLDRVGFSIVRVNDKHTVTYKDVQSLTEPTNHFSK